MTTVDVKGLIVHWSSLCDGVWCVQRAVLVVPLEAMSQVRAATSLIESALVSFFAFITRTRHLYNTASFVAHQQHCVIMTSSSPSRPC